MRAERLNRARKSGNRTAESLRADTGCVDLIENLLLHLGIQRIGVVLIDRTQQRTLGEICRLIARAAQTDADNDRRARVGTRMDARIRDKSTICALVAAGVNIFIWVIFSEPKPWVQP